ncbi:MAG TPA: 3-isopropylmalate dehydratase small subunit [Oceanospirillales bacterium]|nr:3-isopropylmalate dehydratase small subunit [Oceanospirillales bacterium]
MNAVKHIKGVAIPMNITDIDTDIIIPAQYLTSTSQTGYGQHAFARLRAKPDFVLNQSQYQQAPILLTGSNFGCGSSREHAVWAIKELGIQAIIAPSFADIFTNNAKKNGLLLIELAASEVNTLMERAENKPTKISIDIEKQSIQTGDLNLKFNTNNFFKHCLINGLDELDYLMTHIDDIKQFKKQQSNKTLYIKPITSGQS